MSEAARKFEGEHDFTTFAASTGDEEDDNDRTTRRCILSSRMLQVREELHCNSEDSSMEDASAYMSAEASAKAEALAKAEEWIYEVRGRSFMRNMVRKMVGTLIEVGRARLSPEDIPRLLALCDRAQSGPTAQPHALCLHEVEYGECSTLDRPR